MRIAPILLVACLGIACVRTTRNPATGKTDIDIESPTKTGEDWKASLKGSMSYPNVTGASRAMVADGKTTVTVNINGASPGAVHPWHVHEGKCGSGGPIWGESYAYSPLRVGDNGHAEQSATISLQLNEAKDYYVNVHQSASDMATIIACGDLSD